MTSEMKPIPFLHHDGDGRWHVEEAHTVTQNRRNVDDGVEGVYWRNEIVEAKLDSVILVRRGKN